MKTRTQILTIIILSLFLFIKVFALGMSMHDPNHMFMGLCPFMSSTESFCEMQVLEHIADWNTMFVSTLATWLLLVEMITLIFFVFYLAKKIFSPPPTTVNFYPQHHPDYKVFFYLQNFFSRGILHPRLYA